MIKLVDVTMAGKTAIFILKVVMLKMYIKKFTKRLVLGMTEILIKFSKLE